MAPYNDSTPSLATDVRKSFALCDVRASSWNKIIDLELTCRSSPTRVGRSTGRGGRACYCNTASTRGNSILDRCIKGSKDRGRSCTTARHRRRST